MATTYENLAVRFGAETKDLVKGLNDANRAVKDATTKMDTALRGASTAFRALGTVAAAVGVSLSLGFVKRTIDTVGGLGELAQQLGVTTNFLQEMQFAAAQSGVSTEELEGALMKLTRTLSAGQSPQQAMLDLADAIAKTDDPNKKAALAFEYLGRSGQRLLPLLEGGSAALREMAIAANEAGAVISRDMIDQADRASDKMAALNAAFEKIAQTIAAKLGPAFFDLATWFEALVNPSLSQKIGSLKQQIDEIGQSIANLMAQGGSTRQLGINNELIANLEATRNQLQAELATLEARSAALRSEIEGRFKSSGGGLPQTTAEAEKAAKEQHRLGEETKRQLREMTAEIDKQNEAYQREGETIRQSVLTPMEEYEERIRRLQVLREQDAISAETQRRAEEEAKKEFKRATTETEKMSDAARELGFTFSSAFEDAIVSGSRFQDVLRGLLQDIQRIIVRRAIIEPFINSIFGSSSKSTGGLGGILGAIGSIGSIWGGGISGGGVGTGLGQFDFLAEGGPTTANRPYVVGENGPEIFTPSSAGYVSPNGVGGGISIAYSIDARGADPGVDARIRKAMDETTMRTVALVTSLADRGGSFAQKMGRRT